MNQQISNAIGDPETVTRIAQYEMAYRMQMHATDAFDLKQESPATHQMYGTEPGKESFANNCLLARRLAERGVRYIQLFHATMLHLMGFDHERLTYPTQGVSQRLTNITKPGSKVVKSILA